MARRALRWVTAAAAFGFGYGCYVYVTLPDVRSLAARNPETTAFIELRKREAARDGRELRVRQQWVPYSRIAETLRRAVIVAEDAAFFDHEGIDLAEIRASLEANWEEGRFLRGGSTITQQLAKNLYLSPSRNPVRKVRELLITRRLETALTKRRILEIYLNVIEWGDGIFGCDAAARAYFGKPASVLTAAEAALLAGAIINPREHSPARPTKRLLRRQEIILRRMRIREEQPASAQPAPAPAPRDLETPIEPGIPGGTIDTTPPPPPSARPGIPPPDSPALAGSAPGAPPPLS